MARDPLCILQAMRQREVEQARQSLALCLQAEAAAVERISAIDDAVRRDREASPRVHDAYRFVDIFALRLETMQANRRNCVADRVAAENRSAEARAALVAARTAAESVEMLIAQRLEEASREADRREQHALDDINRPRFNPMMQRPDARKADTTIHHENLPE